jgi:hypothetical protein
MNFLISAANVRVIDNASIPIDGLFYTSAIHTGDFVEQMFPLTMYTTIITTNKTSGAG